MRIVLIVQQTFDIEAATLPEAHRLLREGLFPSEESLLAVIDERGMTSPRKVVALLGLPDGKCGGRVAVTVEDMALFLSAQDPPGSRRKRKRRKCSGC